MIACGQARRLRTPKIWIGGAFVLASAGILGFVGGPSFAFETIAMTVLACLALALSILVGGQPPRPAAPDEPAAPDDSDDTVDIASPLRRPPPFPEPLSSFRGRRAELDRLIGQLDEQHSDADSPERSRTRPAILSLHGMPGVGKTELAKALARRLKDRYPDGCLTVSFRKAAEPRPPTEILKEMLTRLHWPEADIPPDAEGRRTLLRTLTKGRRMVFIFDAARSHDQVSRVMPAEPQCTVIITSRRNLAPALELPPSYATQLDVPSAEDALDILGAIADIDWMADAEAAIEAVELCGRLPLAIRSAGSRVVEEHIPLRNVVALLRPRTTRLARLEGRSGRTVLEGILTEFDRLSRDEQSAVCRLSLVQSRTFSPWVLRPLMAMSEHQAELALTALDDAQLLRRTNRAAGRPRYEFNPLIRLFVEAHLAKLPNQDSHELARRRLSDAYRDFARTVVLPTTDQGTEGHGGTAGAGRPHHQASRWSERDIRLEYRNLVRVVLAAAANNDHATCWRVAARLQDAVPEEPHLDTSIEAFIVGRRAALTEGDRIGALDVALAQAGLLSAVERYPEALEQLKEIATEARTLALPANAMPVGNGVPAGSSVSAGNGGSESAVVAAATLRLAQVHRMKALAFLQMGSYAGTRNELATARRLVDPLVDRDEWQILNLLEAENDRYTEPVTDRERESMDDSSQFRADLDQSEAARRRNSWTEAHHRLCDALDRSTGDLRRCAAVHYRTARLYIEQYHDTPRDRTKRARDADSPMQLARKAVSHAAQAVVTFQVMGNRVGVIRAQCLLVRAMVIAGKLLEAERLCDAVKRDLGRHLAAGCPSGQPLMARYHRARGEWLLRDDTTVAAARDALKHAATIYRELEDWSNHDAIWRLLRQLSLPEQASASSTEFERTAQPSPAPDTDHHSFGQRG